MSAVACCIHPRPQPTDAALVQRFQGIPTANLDDCMGRTAALSAAIRPFVNAPLLGQAFTVKVPAGDNLMFHKALDLALPGDVFVIDAFGCAERSIFGELMVSYCKTRGIAGIVVDGSIRDVQAISELGIPVYARGVTPNGPYKNGPGEIGCAVNVGGQVVRPNDIVVGDADGVVIVRPEDAEALLESVAILQQNEARILETIDRDGSYLRPWVDRKLAELGCRGL